MSESARHLLHVEHLVRGVLNAPCCDDEINGGDNNGALRNQKPPALHTVVNADVAASCAFRMPNVGNKVLSDVHGFQQFQFRHSAVPRPRAKHYQNTTVGDLTHNFFEHLFRVWNKLIQTNAARHEGLSHLTALASSVSGRRRYLRFLKNQSAKKYSAINPTAAAPAIHAIQTIGSSSGFVPRRNHSNQSRLLTSAPTVAATNSVAPHSRANAGHRGCVSGR